MDHYFTFSLMYVVDDGSNYTASKLTRAAILRQNIIKFMIFKKYSGMVYLVDQGKIPISFNSQTISPQPIQ